MRSHFEWLGDHLVVIIARRYRHSQPATAPSLNQVVPLSHRTESQRSPDNEAREEARRGSLGMAIHISSPAPLWRNGIPVREAEVGHVHTNGVVDIPFPRSVRDALVEDRLAEEHHWVPNSGWITFRIRSEQDFDHALWLMRLSYLRYALKSATEPPRLFEQESEGMRLNPRIKSLIEPFVPKTAKQGSAEPISAYIPTDLMNQPER